MLNVRYLLYTLILLSFQNNFSQTIEINGVVESFVNVENIHIVNKNENEYAITNKLGEFNIKAKINDTLVFSSIQHFKKSVIVTNSIITLKTLKVVLIEKINNLDEVTVGKILSGNLLEDIKNTEGKAPINFYDVGIPGYTGKIATQSERRLSEASGFNPSLNGNSMGSGGSVSILPVINAITGRTKMLKNRVKLEEKEALIQHIKVKLSKDFLESNPLDEDLIMDFFYFCSDDENFLERCKNQTDFNILVFLKMKYEQYQANMKSSKD